jgi:hypothetical protein
MLKNISTVQILLVTVFSNSSIWIIEGKFIYIIIILLLKKVIDKGILKQ